MVECQTILVDDPLNYPDKQKTTSYSWCMDRKTFVPIFLIVFVDILALTVFLPILPFYAQAFGATPFVVGLLISVFAVCQFLAGPLLGMLSDRYGRKPVLVISQIGTFIGFLIIGFAGSLWMVFLGRVIDGITAGNLTVAQAYLADVSKPEKRMSAFALIGISFGLGFLIGPAISGLLVGYGMNAPIFASAALSLLSIVLTALWLKESHKRVKTASRRGYFPSQKEWKQLSKHPEIFRLLVLFFLFSFSFSWFTGSFPLYLERSYTFDGRPFQAREVSLVLAALGLYGILIQGGLIGRMNRKWGELRLAKYGFFASIVGNLLLAWQFGYIWLTIALMFGAFGSGVIRPALTSLISRSAAEEDQGLVLGLNQSLGSIAQIFAPLLAGALIEINRTDIWAFALTIVSVLAIFPLYQIEARHRRASQA